jgi:hypothetical protein
VAETRGNEGASMCIQEAPTSRAIEACIVGCIGSLAPSTFYRAQNASGKVKDIRSERKVLALVSGFAGGGGNPGRSILLMP